jgi:hypothetical protein
MSEGHSQQIRPMHDKLGDMMYFPAGLRHFVYWMSIFIVAQAMELAFLTSWQQGGYTALQTAWGNAALLFGVVLVWFFFKWMTNRRAERHSLAE